MTDTSSEHTALRSNSIGFYYNNKKAAARFVEDIRTNFPELSQSITITRPLKSVGYYVRIAIKEWSGDTETLRYYSKLAGTWRDRLPAG